MKIVFLDIDGVLNSGRNNTKQYGRSRPFDPEAITALNKILKETEAKIVISSSWRYMYDAEEMGELLMLEGLPKDIVIGETPMDTEIVEIDGIITRVCSGLDGDMTRGEECMKWIEEHYQNGGEYITHFAAIEDFAPMAGFPAENVFWTNPEDGLTMEIADAIIEHLNKE